MFCWFLPHNASQPSHLCVCMFIASLLGLFSLSRCRALGWAPRALQQLRLLSGLHTVELLSWFVPPSPSLEFSFPGLLVFGSLEGGHQDEIRCVGDLVGEGGTPAGRKGEGCRGTWRSLQSEMPVWPSCVGELRLPWLSNTGWWPDDRQMFPCVSEALKSRIKVSASCKSTRHLWVSSFLPIKWSWY